MVTEPNHGPQWLIATYADNLPSMRIKMKIQGTVTRCAFHVHPGGPGDETHIIFWHCFHSCCRTAC